MAEKTSRDKSDLPEKLTYSRYYEHDGALRAYANRAMVLAFLCVPIALIAVALAAYVRLQPPTIIRIDNKGEAALLGAPKSRPQISVLVAAEVETSDLEKRAVARLFLERYLNFSPSNVDRTWADSLNMMTGNLRRSTLASLQKDNVVGRVQEDQISSVFHLRSLDPEKDDPFTFVAYGVKELHRIHDHQERTDKLVGEYHIRLIAEKRTEENPSGLLVADYGEKLIEGERQQPAAQAVSIGTVR
jgi:hypothetical protein